MLENNSAVITTYIFQNCCTVGQTSRHKTFITEVVLFLESFRKIIIYYYPFNGSNF